MNKIHKVLIALLLAFYIFVAFAALNPDVSDAYKAYYITHETQAWKKPG